MGKYFQTVENLFSNFSVKEQITLIRFFFQKYKWPHLKEITQYHFGGTQQYDMDSKIVEVW